MPRAWCAHCGEELRDEGPFGYVHQNGSVYGEQDGHAVLPLIQPYDDFIEE